MIVGLTRDLAAVLLLRRRKTPGKRIDRDVGEEGRSQWCKGEIVPKNLDVLKNMQLKKEENGLKNCVRHAAKSLPHAMAKRRPRHLNGPFLLR